MSQEPWELLRDFDFTDEQWKSILKPLGNVTVTDKDRQAIIISGFLYQTRRFTNFSANQFGWLIRPTQIAECLDQVATAAAKLRTAMRNASEKLDGEILPQMWAADKPAAESLSWNQESWPDLLAQVIALEKTTRDKAQCWAGVKAPPANVDLARDEAWMRLAEIFVRLTGKEPTASARASKTDRYGSGYAAFVESFMAAIPGERRLRDDEIPNFLRTERYRERMQKFLDAHHGLLREH